MKCTNVKFYLENCYKISSLITKGYSTSFSLATSLLEKDKRNAIYAVYGFVRLADEIVDSFDGYDKLYLLDNLESQLADAFKYKISTNVVLNSFIDTVERYHISHEYIDAFLKSMRADLSKSTYNNQSDLDEYIYGSADVVGLICLQIFCDGNQADFTQLSHAAEKLGSAFQKVNFLRDLHADQVCLGRSYFPEVSNENFSIHNKHIIEKSIENDFAAAKIGIKALPGRSKLAVGLAYYYYYALFRKIKNTTPERILSQRVRVCDTVKYFIFFKVMCLYKLNRI